jgi:hypothetical protein
MNIYSLINIQEVFKMPTKDGTGPMGEGPLTGNGMGPCAQGAMGRGFRRGFGRNPRRGLGYSCPYMGELTLTKDEQKKILEEELKSIEEDKKQIEKKLKELK